MHSPNTAAAKEQLAKQAAAAYAMAAVQYIESLPCPAEQKTELLQVLQNETTASKKQLEN